MPRVLTITYALAGVALLGTNGRAQAPSSTPSFEVASVKVSTADRTRQQTTADSFIATAVSLLNLIVYAYEVERFEIANVPDWGSDRVRFDVNAKASFEPSPAQMRLMVQRLLAERFKLRTHTETREMPVYLLRVARSDGRLGTDLKKTTVDCAAIILERQRQSASASASTVDPMLCTQRLIGMPGPSGVTLRYLASGISMGQLANWLTPYAQRTVVDRTGLTGNYDVTLAFSPVDVVPANAAGDSPVPVTTAVREQLGLRMDAAREPVDILVVDDVQMPTPN